jgi:hypothetical protein
VWALSIPLEPCSLKFFSRYDAQLPSYPPVMLGRLQNRTGEPNVRTRAVAALVILGLLVLAAPLVVFPIAHWIARFL